MREQRAQKGRCPTTVGGTVHTPHGALGGSLTLTRDTVTRFTDRLNETAKIVLLLFLSARKRSSSSR